MRWIALGCALILSCACSSDAVVVGSDQPSPQAQGGTPSDANPALAGSSAQGGSSGQSGSTSTGEGATGGQRTSGDTGTDANVAGTQTGSGDPAPQDPGASDTPAEGGTTSNAELPPGDPNTGGAAG